jgi:hypothetical protein
MSKATQRYPSSRPLHVDTNRGCVAKAEREIWQALDKLDQFQREAVLSRINAKVREDRQRGA